MLWRVYCNFLDVVAILSQFWIDFGSPWLHFLTSFDVCVGLRGFLPFAQCPHQCPAWNSIPFLWILYSQFLHFRLFALSPVLFHWSLWCSTWGLLALHLKHFFVTTLGAFAHILPPLTFPQKRHCFPLPLSCV